MIRRPPRSTQSRSSAASDVYKRQDTGAQRGRRCGALARRSATSRGLGAHRGRKDARYWAQVNSDPRCEQRWLRVARQAMAACRLTAQGTQSPSANSASDPGSGTRTSDVITPVRFPSSDGCAWIESSCSMPVTSRGSGVIGRNRPLMTLVSAVKTVSYTHLTLPTIYSV